MSKPKLLGPCYPTTEAFYYLLGGKAAGWTPIQMIHEGISHWAIRHSSGIILDPTVKQFKRVPDYSKARGRGFMTSRPSKRARAILNLLEGDDWDGFVPPQDWVTG